MAPKQIVFAVVTFLHDLFTAAWIGGLLTLVVSVLPAARSLLGEPAAQRLMGAIQRRLRWVVYASMAGLAVTGLLLSRQAPGFQGLFVFGAPYATVLSLKHLAMVGMVAAALGRSLLVPRLRCSEPVRMRWSRALLMINLALGVLVLLLSGVLSAVGAALPGAGG